MSDPDLTDSAPPPEPSPFKKIAVLRQQNARLHVEKEHMIVNVKRNILAGFQRKLGSHDHALKKVEWEVGRLKREVEMVRAASENDGEVDYDRIAGALEEEFDPQEQQLEEAPRKIEWANQRLNALMTHEQTQSFQARYRRLTERLHPDLRTDRDNVTAENLWQRAGESFAAGDTAELEAIEIIAADLPGENLEKLPKQEIEERVARLKKANETAINEIAKMRQEWPYPLAAKLPDEDWVRGQRLEYEQKTAQLKVERDALVEELNHILDTRPSGKE